MRIGDYYKTTHKIYKVGYWTPDGCIHYRIFDVEDLDSVEMYIEGDRSWCYSSAVSFILPKEFLDL